MDNQNLKITNVCVPDANHLREQFGSCGEVSSNIYINVGGNCSCSDKKPS